MRPVTGRGAHGIKAFTESPGVLQCREKRAATAQASRMRGVPLRDGCVHKLRSHLNFCANTSLFVPFEH